MGFGEKNIGPADKVVRIFVALVLFLAILLNFAAGIWAWAVGILALGLLFTVARGTCMLYSLVGINTAKDSSKRRRR